jgi:serine/threonine protein kinase
VFTSLQQEIQLLKSLRHANIVRYIDHVVNTKTNQLYIAMEYIENGSLAQMVKKYGKFPESLARTYVAKIVDGLVYLHEQGVIHRDVKGANILIDKDGVVKLADFGVATKIKASAASAELGENVAVGTPYFMAPEVITFQGIKPQSDVWSLGCTIIEMLSGEPPYASSSPFSAMYRMVEDDHPPFPSGISPALESFLLQCFQKNVDLRLTARELRSLAWLKPAYETEAAAAAAAAPHAAGGASSTSQPASSKTTSLRPLPPLTNFSAATRELLNYNEALDVVRSHVPAKSGTPDPVHPVGDGAVSGVKAAIGGGGGSAGSGGVGGVAASALAHAARVTTKVSALVSPRTPRSAALLASADASITQSRKGVPQTAPHSRHVGVTAAAGGRQPTRPRSGTHDAGQGSLMRSGELDDGGDLLGPSPQQGQPMRRQSARGHNLSKSSFVVLPEKADEVRAGLRKALMQRFAPKTSLDRFKERNMRDEWDNDYLPPNNSDEEDDDNMPDVSMRRSSSGALQRRSHVRKRSVPLGIAGDVGVKIAALRTASDERNSSVALAGDAIMSDASRRALLGKSANSTPASSRALPHRVTSGGHDADDDDDEDWDVEFATATADAASPRSVPVNRSLKLALDTTPPHEANAAGVKKRVRTRRRKTSKTEENDNWQSVSSDDKDGGADNDAAVAATNDDDDDDNFDRDFDLGFGKWKDNSRVGDWGELLAPKLDARPDKRPAAPLPNATVSAMKVSSASEAARRASMTSERLSQYKDKEGKPADADFDFGSTSDDEPLPLKVVHTVKPPLSHSHDTFSSDSSGDIGGADDDEHVARGGGGHGGHGAGSAGLQLAARFTSVPAAASAEVVVDWDDTSGSEESAGEKMDAAARNDAVLREKFQEALLREILQQIDLLCGSYDDGAAILGALEHLQHIFDENPGQEMLLITNHGLLPLIALIERGSANAVVLNRTLELVINIGEDPDILSNLCVMGAIPAVMACAAPQQTASVRALAARFIQQVICGTSQTLQMFIACKGLAALVGLLDANDYDSDRELLWSAVTSIEMIFRLQHEVSAPRNEFLHLFVNCSFLAHFGPAMYATLSDHDAPPARRAATANLLTTFARGDARLKRALCSAETGFLPWVRQTFDVLPPDDENNLTLLKALRELSSDSTTLRSLEIFLERVVQLGNTFVQRKQFPAELFNRAIQFLFDMCRFDRKRQETAASCGIVPFLLTVIFSNKPVKEFAVPIFTDLARTSMLTRNILWKNDGLRYYLQLTQDPYWHMDALGAIAAWLPHERERLEQTLLSPENVQSLVGTLRFGNASALVSVLESLESIASLSPLLGQALGRTEFGLIELLAPHVQHSNPHVRVNVVKLVVALCQRAPNARRMLRRGNMYDSIQTLARADTSLLVQNIANTILLLAGSDGAGDASPRLDGATTSDTSGRSSPVASPVLSHASSSASVVVASHLGPSPSASPRISRPSVSSASGGGAASVDAASAGQLQRDLEHLKHAPTKAVVWIEDSELTICELLGSGASGSVYRGYYRNTEVAIKELKDGEDDAGRIEEFRKEFAILSAMDHKLLILLYGCSIQPRLRLVMEFAPGGSLDSLLSNVSVNFTWEMFFSLMTQLCQAVNVLHQWTPQILHRDIKPLNLLLTRNHDLKLGDFGLSRFNSNSNANTLGKIRGTMAYAAPETYAGQPYTTKSDVYSVGMIVWETVTRCMTGAHERPFSEFKNIKFDFQIIMHAAKKHVRPTIPARTPTSLRAAIERSWNKDVPPRPEALELLALLQTSNGKYNRHREQWNELLGSAAPQAATTAAAPAPAPAPAAAAAAVGTTTPVPEAPEQSSREAKIAQIEQQLKS